MVCGLHCSKARSKTNTMFVAPQMITLTSQGNQITGNERTRIQPADMASQSTLVDYRQLAIKRFLYWYWR